MKNIIKFACCVCAAALFASSADAAVNFIVQQQKGSSSHSTPQIHTCLRKGYSKRSCPEGQNPADTCPEDSSFFRTCCDSAFNYTYEQCINNNMIPAGQCGGKYRCAAKTRRFYR